MPNFSFLQAQPEYTLFSSAAIEAERVFAASPAMCAVGCRKALELAVKWVYAADRTMKMPYKHNLQSLIHEPTFRFALDSQTWAKLPFVVKLGNLAVHTERAVLKSDALLSLKSLFELIQWIDYCYGANYAERHFDEEVVPTEQVVVNPQKIKEQQSLLEQKESEIQRLQKQIEALSAQYTAEKQAHLEQRHFAAGDLSEYATRQRYIDLDLKLMGWQLEGVDADVRQEYPVEGMAGKPGQKGKADYVLFGRDGLPLAVVEAKKTSKDPNSGRRQAVLYADCLERKFGRRPMMFTTNGFETYFWDDKTAPQRQVSGIFSKSDLQKLMNRREERKNLDEIPIDDRITDRYYQKEAIRAVCDNITKGYRKNLLVMATGTGKTRTASSLTDVLSRAGYVTNILFLADRTALVKQARDDFKSHLQDMSLCNLLSGKDDRNARVVFSTYPTMLNAIDDAKTEDGQKLFTPAHFDLIIIDESHRSIFKKYRAIFEYFDAVLVGLTATPKTDVDRNTYDFFEMEHRVPTYAYDYETAVYTDHVLVPYYNFEVTTKFEEEKGIFYDTLSEADKARYEEDFTEDDGAMPVFIPSEKLNKFIFNEQTADHVLQDLMERGIKVAGGDRIGKTILFAQNKHHAEFILERFNKLYPHLKGRFAQRVICDDSYAQTIIDDFKQPEKEPHIVVSVDMMDTGIDVPECVNLVFFKKVRSKTKFWQMIGRGTRLCEGLECVDGMDGSYTGKRRFLIFDYCGNFAFFREPEKEFKGSEAKTLSEAIFSKKVRLIALLQEGTYADQDCQDFRAELVRDCHAQVSALNPELVRVRLRLRYVEKYKEISAYTALSETDQGELIAQLAPLVFLDDTDEAAKRFDNFIYGMMLANLALSSRFSYAQRQLCDLANALTKKASIPQVKAALPLLQSIQSKAFWEDFSILQLEQVRGELRWLMKFLEDGNGAKHPIITNLADPVVSEQAGQPLGPAYDFEDYRLKVNRYVGEHGNTLAIYKLTHNIPLASGDYQELERVFTEELGTKEDYQREYGNTPFGLLIRKIAKLDHAAAMAAFSEFINDQSLNQGQIAFIHKVIQYVEQNGYIEDMTDLMKPPFDKPVGFIKLFDTKAQTQLVQVVTQIKENAIHVGA